MSKLLDATLGVFTGLRELTREVRGVREALQQLVELQRLQVTGTMQTPGPTFRSGYQAGPETEGGLVRSSNDEYTELDEIRGRCRTEGLPEPELDEDLRALAKDRGW